MSMNYTSIVAIGEVFDTEDEIIGFVNTCCLVSLQPQNIMELQDSVYNYFNNRQNKGYPVMDCLNLYTGNGGYYIGYDITDKNPQQMIEKIQKYTKQWKTIFKTEPKIINEVKVS